MLINQNTHKNNNWLVKIEKFPELEFHLKRFPIPSCTIDLAEIPTTGQIDYSTPGEKITYLPLSLQFDIDEDLVNYRTLYEWMKTLVVNQDDTTNIQLYFTSNKGNFQKNNMLIEFRDCWVSEIMEVDLSTNDDSIVSIASAIFRYSSFDFVDRTPDV